jgi:linker histone H1 and H5 family
VQYVGEDDSVFHEDLSPSSATSWQLRRDDDAPATRSKPSVNYAPVKKGSYQTYADMCVNAVRDLGEAKSGWSLAAIRKRVAVDHPETNKKHTASFNALTLKALNKAVAEGILERTSKTAYRYCSCNEYLLWQSLLVLVFIAQSSLIV